MIKSNNVIQVDVSNDNNAQKKFSFRISSKNVTKSAHLLKKKLLDRKLHFLCSGTGKTFDACEIKTTQNYFRHINQCQGLIQELKLGEYKAPPTLDLSSSLVSAVGKICSLGVWGHVVRPPGNPTVFLGWSPKTLAFITSILTLNVLYFNNVSCLQ